MLSKKTLRKTAKNILADIPDSSLPIYSQKVYESIFNTEDFQNSKNVFTYLSVNKEVPTRLFIEKTLSLKNKNIFIPKTLLHRKMIPVKINSLDDLEENKFGILEPKIKNTNLEEKPQIDLAIIPCLGVDKNNNRLGYGGGYYDKFLKDYTNDSILLCYKELIFDEIPSEPHDIKMKKIIYI